eukprot:4813071-Pyramimonas_sp.AAC.1
MPSPTDRAAPPVVTHGGSRRRRRLSSPATPPAYADSFGGAAALGHQTGPLDTGPSPRGLPLGGGAM